MNTYDIVLPPEIHAVVGREISIYFDNLLIGNADRYYLDVSCTIGQHQNERWTCVPEKAGDYPVIIELFDEHMLKLSSAAATIKVWGGERDSHLAHTLLVIGDSLIFKGHFTAEMLRMFEEDRQDMTLIGTRGIAPNSHEGRSGWKVNTFYTGQESPFLFDGIFDFKRYMKENGYAHVDYVCIHLGINDVIKEKDDAGVHKVIEMEMPMLEKMMESIHDFDSGIHIGLLVTIPPSRHQDSFGTNYGASLNRWRYKRNILMWNKEFISQFAGRIGQNIHLVPVNVNLDTVHNMISQQVPANSRSSIEITRQMNGVHPAVEGYHQMADVTFYWIKNIRG